MAEKIPEIKQLIPAEPGWYVEEEVSEGYNYHRVICWALAERLYEEGSVQFIGAVLRFDIGSDFVLEYKNVIFAPNYQVHEFFLKKSLKKTE